MFATGKSAATIIEERGLVQVSDASEIDRLIDDVIAASPQQLEQYRSGKETLVWFLRWPGAESVEGQGQSESRKRKIEGETTRVLRSFLWINLEVQRCSSLQGARCL